jgi:transposase
MVIEGAMTGDMFLAYVEQCLIPTLRRNDIVVMDNCRVHIAPTVRKAIEKANASVRYLPKYSPDLTQLAQLEGYFCNFAYSGLSWINRLVGFKSRFRHVVPTKGIF